jgi:NAD(P)-dependent dehydrogenase (short-subunit alcohol dehydrogenase family)
LDLHLEGRVAIVTGASRGIGRAVVERLFEEGADVVGVSRSKSRGLPVGVVHVEADLLDEKVPADVVESALAAFGRLDILVNNAGSGRVRSGYDGVSPLDWRRAWELLFLSQVRMTAAALPHLLAHRSGVVINVSSSNARVPAPRAPDYSAAKAALANYSKGLALQFAAQGLRVVAVSPGPVATMALLGPDGVAAQIAAMEGRDLEEVVSQIKAAVPLGRLVEPFEVADLIVFLASARASMISGVDVLIDGALTHAP